MSVWDLMYLTGQFKKYLALAGSAEFDEAARKDFEDRAEQFRLQLIEYMDKYGKRINETDGIVRSDEVKA